MKILKNSPSASRGLHGMPQSPPSARRVRKCVSKSQRLRAVRYLPLGSVRGVPMAQSKRLNADQVAEIRGAERTYGYMKAFARRFGCSIRTIRRARRREDGYA